MFKRILVSLGSIILLAGLIVGIRYWNSRDAKGASFDPIEEAVVRNEDLEKLSGSGYQLVDESDQLQLFVSFDDGNIRVVNKQNGYEWSSRPSEEEMAIEKSNALWKNNLTSPVMFTYTTQISGGAAPADTKYSNVLSQETDVTVYRKDDGTRVYFHFKELDVTFGYDIRVEGDAVRVNIPSYLISDPGEVYKESSSGKKSLDKKKSCVVAEFFLFPSLGATRSNLGNQGAMLVPDGMGALMDFESDKFVNSQYIAHVYGSDMALNNGFDSPLRAEMRKPVVSFPVFGVIRDGNTMLAVLDEGECNADIIASKAGVQTGFNTVAARYSYRLKYKVVTNATSGDGYLRYTDQPISEPRTIVYYFGTGDYVDMAATYRGYLMAHNGLTRLDADEEVPMQLNIVGGDVETGVAGASFIAMTTFEQAGDMLNWYSEQGVKRMDVTLTGWSKRGESIRYPDRFPAASALGGNSGLTELSERAQALERPHLPDG